MWDSGSILIWSDTTPSVPMHHRYAPTQTALIMPKVSVTSQARGGLFSCFRKLSLGRKGGRVGLCWYWVVAPTVPACTRRGDPSDMPAKSFYGVKNPRRICPSIPIGSSRGAVSLSAAGKMFGEPLTRLVAARSPACPAKCRSGRDAPVIRGMFMRLSLPPRVGLQKVRD